MNKYTCTNCGKVSVIRDSAKEIANTRCTCRVEPVKLVIGVHKFEKAAKQDQVDAPTLPEIKQALPNPPKVFNSQSVQVPVNAAPQPPAATKVEALKKV